MRIMISSNAPWIGSGYGQQAKFLVESFTERGHEVIFDANFGLSSGSLEKDGVLYLSDYNYGNYNILNYAEVYQPDIVVSLVDWHAVKNEVWSRLKMPWYNWTPIDMHLSSNKKDVFYDLFNEYLETCKVVTMSSFGTKQVEKYGHKPEAQIYHIVDSDIFKRLDKIECRDKIIPNHKNYDLIVGMVMGNYDPKGNRKAFDLQFQALRLFAEQNPSLRVLLYMHTELTHKLGGLDLHSVLQQTDLEKFVDVMYSPPMKVSDFPYTQEELAALYNCFDILMNASTGEGFGIPIIEAQSCGVPVLTHNFSAMPELTHYGYAAAPDMAVLTVLGEVQNKYYSECGHVINGEFVMGVRAQPDIKDMAQGLSLLNEAKNEKASFEAHEWVAKNFNRKVIGDAWDNLLTGKRG